MKNFLLLLFMFGVFACYAQKKTKKIVKPGYTTITLQGNTYEDGHGFGGAFNMGIKASKVVGIGAGMEVVKFDNRTPYAPVYADLRIFGPYGRKVGGFLMLQPGYGFLDYSDRHSFKVASGPSVEIINNSITGQGGFYFGGGIGVTMKTKPSPIITLRYCTYGTSYKYVGDYFRPQSPLKRVDAVALNVGIRF